MVDKVLGSGCGSVGRVVAFETRGLQYNSSHRQNFIEHLLLNLFIINCIEKTKINKLKLGMALVFKKERVLIIFPTIEGPNSQPMRPDITSSFARASLGLPPLDLVPKSPRFFAGQKDRLNESSSNVRQDVDVDRHLGEEQDHEGEEEAQLHFSHDDLGKIV